MLQVIKKAWIHGQHIIHYLNTFWVIIHTSIDASYLKHHVHILISNYYKTIYQNITDINMHN